MKKRVFLFLMILLFVYSLGGIIYLKYIYVSPNEPVIKNLDSILGYDYVLRSNASSLYKTEFNILKENLEGDINEEEYLKSVCKLYIIDLYSMRDKLNKYDINTDFIYEKNILNYKLNLQDTLYKYLEDNSDGKRVQELPSVSSVDVVDVKDTTFKIGDENAHAKEVSLKWEYDKDLGYDNKGTLVLVKENNLYYIVEYK